VENEGSLLEGTKKTAQERSHNEVSLPDEDDVEVGTCKDQAVDQDQLNHIDDKIERLGDDKNEDEVGEDEDEDSDVDNPLA